MALLRGIGEDFWVGACTGLADLILNSQPVLGFTKTFLPTGVVSIAQAHSADKGNAFIVSASLGMTGSALNRMVKGPLMGRRRK